MLAFPGISGEKSLFGPRGVGRFQEEKVPPAVAVSEDRQRSRNIGYIVSIQHGSAEGQKT